MKRIGALIRFKEGVSTAEAAMALNQIRNVLELPEAVAQPAPEVQSALDAGQSVRFDPSQWTERPFNMKDAIQEWDDDWGNPVWYIP